MSLATWRSGVASGRMKKAPAAARYPAAARRVTAGRHHRTSAQISRPPRAYASRSMGRWRDLFVGAVGVRTVEQVADRHEHKPLFPGLRHLFREDLQGVRERMA